MDSYPNVWPTGGWFGFSGLDGETRFDEPFVMSGRQDELGWNFYLEPRPRILVTVGSHRLRPANAQGDFVLPDCWYCTVGHKQRHGVVEGAFCNRASFALLVAFDELPENQVPDLLTVGKGDSDESGATIEGDGWWLVVRKSEPGTTRRFGIAVSYASEDEAASRAANALESDLRDLINKRLGFTQLAHVPDSVVDIKRRTYLKAAGVLKMNIESPQGRFRTRWFRSDPAHHRRGRLFDTVFYALGQQYVHEELAQDSITAALSAIQPDGRIPLAFGPETDKGFSPEYTHPPLLTWVVSELFARSQDVSFARKCYPVLQQYVEWFDAHRKRDNGLYGWKIRTEDAPPDGARGAEACMGNSPRFDTCTEMTAVDLSAYMAAEYRALEILALELGHSEDAGKYRDRNRSIIDLVNELLWDTEDLFYYDLDEDGVMIPIMTTAGFMPLLAGIPDRDQTEALRTHLMHPHEFWTQTPVPSVAEDAPEFSKDMWRGATWPVSNALLYQGLVVCKCYEEAHELARRTVNEISYRYALSGCLFEYYDPLGSDLPTKLPRRGSVTGKPGDGLGVIQDHQPTAAVYIYLTQQLAHP